VKTILTNPTNQKIIGSIVELGTELGISVIAEYVETKEQQQMLQSLGCNCYQGYYYSKPIPLDEFIAYITNQNSQT
jgi:EAL domain-containing protein (putative c-di-GMP-specific phosphodiesterase class I)